MPEDKFGKLILETRKSDVLNGLGGTITTGPTKGSEIHPGDDHNIYLGDYVDPGMGGIIAGPSNAAMRMVVSKDNNSDIAFDTRKNGLDFAVERMRIDRNGNVGIGTKNPSEKLDVFGAIKLYGRDAFQGHDSYLRINQNNEFFSGTHFAYRANFAGGITIGSWLDMEPGSGNLLVEGNVGIGTRIPKSPLHVNVPGSGNPLSAMTVDVQTFGTVTNAQASNFFQVRDIGAEPPIGKTHFIINGLGDVGIGTNTPSAKLEVNGDIKVTGDIILTNADCAEDFDITCIETVEPGTVMVIDNGGALKPSQQAYDKRVAGVISGAGDLRPGITLDRQKERTNRLPLALNGKVYCKVDAEYTPVEVGDLLTTSSTIGHAMKADDRDKAFGAVIGKALHELEGGKGLIPILVALQ